MSANVSPGAEGRQLNRVVRPILTDVHFLIPLVVLLIGIALLVELH